MTFASRPDLTAVVDVHMHHCSTRITAECYSGMLRWPMSWQVVVHKLEDAHYHSQPPQLALNKADVGSP